MSFEAIKSGAVIAYPYLWSRQAARGETEGRKTRPSAVAVRLVRKNGTDKLILLAITTQPPRPEQIAAEIPELEKRRGGLSVHLRQWIVLDECNEDKLPGSFFIGIEKPLGKLSTQFFVPLVVDFVKRRHAVRSVLRHD